MTAESIVVTIVGLKDIVLGLAGGMVAYLFDYSRASREGDTQFVFRFSSMIINMLLGAFVAYTVGTLLPTDISYRDAVIGFSGVTAYNILLIAESRFANWVIDKIMGKGK